jgi:hypothetical protein
LWHIVPNTLIIRDLRKAGQLIEVHIKNKEIKWFVVFPSPLPQLYDGCRSYYWALGSELTAEYTETLELKRAVSDN